MKHNWVLIVGIVAVLAIPFGLAAFEDSTRESAEDRYRKARAAGDDEEQMRALDDMTAEEVGRIVEDGLLDDDDTEVVAEWEREEEPLDLGFLDEYLAADRPGLAGELAAHASFDQRLSARAEEINDYDGLTLSFTTLGLDEDTAGLVAVTLIFDRDTRVEDRLVDKYGPGKRTANKRLWSDDETGIKIALLTDTESWTILVARYDELDPLLQLFDSKVGVLGKPASELELSDGQLMLRSPLASRRPYTEIDVELDADDAVDELSMTVDLSLEDGAVARAEEQIARRFGTPTSERIGDMRELSFPRQRGLSAYVYSDRVVLTRRRSSSN